MEIKKNKTKYAQCLYEELYKTAILLKDLCKSFILKSTTFFLIPLPCN